MSLIERAFAASECGPDPSSIFYFFHTLEYLQLSCHILSIFSLPIGVYGLFVIYVATPKKLKSSRNVMLNLQFWTVFLDITYNILIIPFVFLPQLAQLTSGLLEKLHFPHQLFGYLVQESIIFLGISTIMVYENRHSKISTIRFRITRNWMRFCIFGAQYLGTLAVLLPFYLEEVDTEAIKLQIQKDVPCISPLLWSDRTQVLAINQSIGIFIYIVIIIAAIEFNIFATYTVIHLIYVPNIKISAATRKLQQKFLFAFSVQAAVPVLILSLPVLVGLYYFTTGGYNQAANNNMMVAFCSHGLFSSITLIIMHQPYREYTVENIIRKITKPKKILNDISGPPTKNLTFVL